MALAIQKSRTPSVKGRLLSTLIMAFALMLQPMYGVVAGQVASAVSGAPLSVDVICQDSKAVLTLTTRQAQLPGVPEEARNWNAAVTYRAGEYGNKVQTLSENDVDIWTIPTDKYSVDAVEMSAQVVGGYTMREDIIVLGQKVGSWDRPYVYTETLYATSPATVCDTTKPSVDVSLDKNIISLTDSSNPRVTINATDSESGVDYVQYKVTPKSDTNTNLIGWVTVPNGSTTEVLGANSLGDGHYTLRARAFDNVGNKSSGNDVDFMVDSTDATTQILAPVRDEPISGTYRFHGIATDNVSGVEKVLIRIGTLEDNDNVFTGWTNFNPATDEWYLDVDTVENNIPDGIYSVRARAIDNAGNQGNSGMHVLRNFVVDNTAPKINSGSVEFNKMVNIGGVDHTSAKLGDGFLEVTFTTDEPLKLVGSQVGLSVPGLSGVPSTGWTKVELVDASENKYMARISLVDRTDTNIPGYEGFFSDKTFKDVKLYFRTVDALNNTDAVYYYADGSFGKSPSKAYRFTIDNTAPTLEVSSPVGDSTYLTTEDINVETDVGDDIEIDRIVIFVNGRYFGDYDSRQVVKDFATAKGGSSFFTIPAGVLPVGEHRLIVNAYDKAGNLTTVRVPLSVVESEEGQEPVDRPGQPEDITPTPESLNTGEGEDEDEEIETNSQAFPGPVLAFGNQGVLGNQGTETDPVDDSEVEGEVAGEQDETGTPLSDTAAFGMDAPKLLGLVWYWWVAILAAIVGGWLLIAAAIRRGREEEA